MRRSPLKTWLVVQAESKLIIKIKKLRFCGEQVKKDGLQYFWVDSCRIKKSSDSTLSESINCSVLTL